MLKTESCAVGLIESRAELAVIFRFEDDTPTATENAINEKVSDTLSRNANRHRFTGKSRQTVVVDTYPELPFEAVMLLGMGQRSDLSPSRLRDAGALIVAEATKRRLANVAMQSDELNDEQCEQLLLGCHLGGYRFDEYQATPEDGGDIDVELVTLAGTAHNEKVHERAAILAEGVCLSRKLINEPANICTPERMADLAAEIAQAPGFELTVLNREEITEKGFGGMVAVSQGAAREPRFIHMSYTPVGGTTEPAIALVGKGLTFDAGGLCIKPAKGMAEMYIDMGGSAAVMGTMMAISKLQPNRAVHGIIGACENMTGADAYRPSDILTMYSGKTVEVLNTDAEGRLVLADAITYAREFEPECIVDLATLTGACMVGLGPNYAGLFSDHDDLAERLTAAAQNADETIWRLPLDKKLAETLKSKRADITNIGGPYGGAITAAQFLQHFAGDTPWAHIDLAGPILARKDDGYVKTGGTGYAVMTLVAFIEG